MQLEQPLCIQGLMSETCASIYDAMYSYPRRLFQELHGQA